MYNQRYIYVKSIIIFIISLFPPIMESIIHTVQLQQHQIKINNINMKVSENKTVNVQYKQNIYIRYKYLHSFIHSFIYSFIQSFIHLFNHSFIYSFLHTSYYLFVHSFTDPMNYPFNNIVFEFNTTLNQYTATVFYG